MILNAEDKILGRLASHIAQEALKGKEVHVINAEKAVITGKKREIIQKYKDKREKGSHSTGPHFPRLPEKIVKRTARGMLPYKKSRGRQAFKNIKCYVGVPNDINEDDAEDVEEIDISQSKSRFITVQNVSEELKT